MAVLVHVHRGIIPTEDQAMELSRSKREGRRRRATNKKHQSLASEACMSIWLAPVLGYATKPRKLRDASRGFAQARDQVKTSTALFP